MYSEQAFSRGNRARSSTWTRSPRAAAGWRPRPGRPAPDDQQGQPVPSGHTRCLQEQPLRRPGTERQQGDRAVVIGNRDDGVGGGPAAGEDGGRVWSSSVERTTRVIAQTPSAWNRQVVVQVCTSTPMSTKRTSATRPRGLRCRNGGASPDGVGTNRLRSENGSVWRRSQRQQTAPAARPGRLPRR